jgi:hypothetical protein
MNRLEDVIHKEEKESKRRNTKGQLPYVHKDIRTNGKGSTHDSQVNSTIDTKGDTSQGEPPSFVQSRKDVELDYYMHSLVIEGLIDFDFVSWHCGAYGTLGAQRYNMLVLKVRRAVAAGKEGRAKPIRLPAHLLSGKVKGALQLHAREQYYSEGEV